MQKLVLSLPKNNYMSRVSELKSMGLKINPSKASPLKLIEIVGREGTYVKKDLYFGEINLKLRSDRSVPKWVGEFIKGEVYLDNDNDVYEDDFDNGREEGDFSEKEENDNVVEIEGVEFEKSDLAFVCQHLVNGKAIREKLGGIIVSSDYESIYFVKHDVTVKVGDIFAMLLK